jgi:D-alanyl-D-alanine carboxypeptidase/D-alanyl-D-alanine-endopeptidase (penicillin-binding protein 4)
MKLQTSSAGLDRLGPDHVFKTYLAMDGDDLWLIGTGDPACGDSKIEAKYGRTTMSMLDDWAAALKARGVTNIKGNLYFYDGAFDTELTEHTWSKGFLTDWYAAPVSGLNFNDNCIDVTAYPTDPGEKVRLDVIPPTIGNRIVNEATTGDADAKATIDIDRDRNNNTFTVKGIAKEKKALQSKPVTDPGGFFADALRTDLKAHGIVIAGKTMRAASPLSGLAIPPADKIIATHETKFTDILSRINKNSQNLFAEALSKYQGRAFAKSMGMDVPGSWKLGGESVRAFLHKNHIDDSKLVYVDGSGLARGNKVTTRLISDELAVMHTHPYHETFFNSLAVAGKDGTIGKRMDDLQGHVFGKTGYIGGVRALSGYIRTRDDKWLAFSIIFNKLPSDVAPAEDVQDNVCRVLVEWPRVENAKLKPVRAATTKASD